MDTEEWRRRLASRNRAGLYEEFKAQSQRLRGDMMDPRPWKRCDPCHGIGASGDCICNTCDGRGKVPPTWPDPDTIQATLSRSQWIDMCVAIHSGAVTPDVVELPGSVYRAMQAGILADTSPNPILIGQS